MKILVTGAAGFIGSFVAERLAKDGHIVVGIDNLCDYYDISLKRARLERISKQRNFYFELIDVTDGPSLSVLFATNQFDHVIHLAAQPGVQHSKIDPARYVHSNISGMLNILENCRLHGIKHLVYASSSSVYGDCAQHPVQEGGHTDSPLSLYAATKKSNELMAHSYSNLYQLPTTGLRFFSVYGPWGRPDMAPYIFTKAILEGQSIDLYGDGAEERAFTYIDDVVEVIARIHERYPRNDLVAISAKLDSTTPFEIFNVGAAVSIRVDELISIIEDQVKLPAKVRFNVPRSGDAKKILCAPSKIFCELGISEQITAQEGIERFIGWYKSYYRENLSFFVEYVHAETIEDVHFESAA
jgi:UDP-glucuronate 4-epimerase